MLRLEKQKQENPCTVRKVTRTTRRYYMELEQPEEPGQATIIEESEPLLLEGASQTSPVESEEQEQENTQVEDEYLPPAEEEFTQSEVTETITETTEESETETKIEPEQTPKRKRSLLALLLCVFVVLLVFGSGAGAVYYFFPRSASIWIAREEKPLSQKITIPMTSLKTQPLNANFSKAFIIKSTGSGMIQAQAAHGFLTLYNGLHVTQTIAVFTLQVNGIVYTTDNQVSIEGAVGGLQGVAHVSAHATQTGIAGNLSAYAIDYNYSESINVTNTTPFIGGSDQQRYTFLQPSDVTTSETQHKIEAQSYVDQDLKNQQKQKGVTGIPAKCQTTVMLGDQPGAEVTQTTLTVKEACFEKGYTQENLTEVINSQVEQFYQREIAQGYKLSLLAPPPPQVSDKILTVSVSGNLYYQLSRSQLNNLASHIAGMPSSDAEAYIEKSLNGHGRLNNLHVSSFLNDNLPTNPQSIQIQYV